MSQIVDSSVNLAIAFLKMINTETAKRYSKELRTLKDQLDQELMKSYNEQEDYLIEFLQAKISNLYLLAELEAIDAEKK